MSITPIAIGEPPRDRPYDLVLAALGYESRAPHLSLTLRPIAECKVALGFKDGHVLAYDENRRRFADARFDIRELDDQEFDEEIAGILAGLISRSGDQVEVWLDVSCFSRIRLAHLIERLANMSRNKRVVLHVAYNIAQFSPPDRDDLPMKFAAPVSRDFAGWSHYIDMPTVALVGLGYEHGKALGAVEYLQADEICVFDPRSPIPEYRPALDEANRSLIEAVPNSRKLSYDVMNPHDLFVRMESLIFGLLRGSRPIILPFGPKIFTTVALLIAKIHPEVAVWRVSGGEPIEPSDRLPSEHSVVIHFDMQD